MVSVSRALLKASMLKLGGMGEGGGGSTSCVPLIDIPLFSYSVSNISNIFAECRMHPAISKCDLLHPFEMFLSLHHHYFFFQGNSLLLPNIMLSKDSQSKGASNCGRRKVISVCQFVMVP